MTVPLIMVCFFVIYTSGKSDRIFTIYSEESVDRTQGECYSTNEINPTKNVGYELIGYKLLGNR